MPLLRIGFALLLVQVLVFVHHTVHSSDITTTTSASAAGSAATTSGSHKTKKPIEFSPSIDFATSLRQMLQPSLQKLGVLSTPQQGVCSPSLFEVEEIAHPVKSAVFRWGAMTASDVLQHVLHGLPQLTFASLPLSPFQNVDGRFTQPTLATMGGDAGELLLALNAFERYLPVNLTSDQISLLVVDYLLTTDINTFVVQMDQDIVVKLCDKGCCLPACRSLQPSQDELARLLENIRSPELQGSAHFRNILRDPDAFVTREPLTKAFVETIFRIFWNQLRFSLGSSAMKILQSKIQIVIPNGIPHSERAILQVRTRGCNPAHTPMLPPNVGGSSIFLVYEDAAQHRRAFNAEWLTQQAKKMRLTDAHAYDRDHLMHTMNQVANTQYVAALVRDKGQTPTFALSFPASCCA
eukprot:c12332_g1_i1.p1 GENE.c12332_g1_i1~~c12332_g1_i1.p1  ORF type:complete len:409 (+),score=108.20 c12332_g1_i1:29-1255(+)